MGQSKITKKQQQILWRQQKVLELSSSGFSEREIAAQLQMDNSTVHRDLMVLKQQAKKEIRKYIDERVPFEFHKTLTGLEGIIKSMATIIANSTNDNKEIMQATTVKMQAYNMKMELVSNANLIDDAINLVEKYRDYTTTKDKKKKIQEQTVIENDAEST